MIAVLLSVFFACAPARAAKIVEVPLTEPGAQLRPLATAAVGGEASLRLPGTMTLPGAQLGVPVLPDPAAVPAAAGLAGPRGAADRDGPSAKAELGDALSAPARFDAPLGPGAAAGEALTPDQIVYRGWQLAQRSKSQRARFGAMVVDQEGRIVGEGWNRQSTKAERKFLKIGLIMHAEQAAVFQAAKKIGSDLEGVRLYVVGISKDATQYASKIRPSIACDICARILQRNKVDVMSSSEHGYVRISWANLVALAKGNKSGKWWQSTYKGKPQDPNIRWLPIAEVERRLKEASAYRPEVRDEEFQAQLKVFRSPSEKNASNGVAFRESGSATPQVLTLRIKRFFFDKILSGEKRFEYRAMGRQNDALIAAAVQRGAKFLRLHFQDNDVQLLAVIEKIDVVPGAQAAEPWDKEQGTEPGDEPHWRIALRSPALIWDNPKSRSLARDRSEK